MRGPSPSDILCPATSSFCGRLERLIFFDSPNSGTESFLGLCVLYVSYILKEVVLNDVVK